MLPLWVRPSFLSSVILTAAFLSGCLGTNPVTPTKLYVLNPVEYKINLVEEMEAPPVLSVEIASLHLPQYLDKPQIMTRSSQNQLSMADYHQWGGNLQKNMIRAVAQNISRLLATPNVTMPPFRPSPPPDLRLDVEVMQFEADGNGQVTFSAQWRLSLGRNGKTLTTRMTNLEKKGPGGGSDFDAIVLTMDALLGDFCHIIGREILDQTVGTSGQ